MKQSILALLAAVMLLGSAGTASAASDQEQKVEDATTVIRQFVDIPENAIPPTLLRQAHGIAVIPSVVKVGFILGGRRGKGVLSVRTASGRWSDPSFITLTGGSIGWQAGISSTDIILVFKTQRSVDRIANGQISLGGDVAVAAGPVGRSAGASTNLDFNAEVYSYSRARGLFAGASLEGARIGIDKNANWLFYDSAGIKADTILRSTNHSAMPKAGQTFVYTLDRYLPRAGHDADGNGGANDDSRDNAASARGAQNAPAGAGNGQAQPYSNDGGVTVQRRGQGHSDGYGGAGDASAAQGGHATGAGGYGASQSQGNAGAAGDANDYGQSGGDGGYGDNGGANYGGAR